MRLQVPCRLLVRLQVLHVGLFGEITSTVYHCCEITSNVVLHRIVGEITSTA